MSGIGALWSKNRKSFRNISRVMESQSGLKVVFVTTFVLLFEAGLWALFLDGFRFLNSFEGLGALIIGRLFSLFFLGMGIMLAISSVVTSYSTIFRSEEIPFLLVRPFHVSEIVSYKFLESAGLSSWAFFFIIIPFVGAYACFRKTTILIPLWTFVFSIPFVLLCAALGTMAVLALARWVPRGRWTRMIALAPIGLAAAGLWWMGRQTYDPSGEAYFNISQLVPGLQLATNALIPSWWVSEGILSLSREEWFRGAMLWGVLASTAVMGCLGVEWLGGRTFYDSWQQVVGRRQESERGSPLFGGLRRVLGFLPRDIRAVVMKDTLTFFRDPVQWSQALIFFGLLGIYFANLRSFNYHVKIEDWRNMLGFLNVFSVAAVMCSLIARFAYPQLSLEGQGFWVVGLSPTSMKRLLLTKFWMAAVSMTVIGLILVLLSCGMLNMPWTGRVTALFVISAVSLAVSGLSTGLGAVFLDLRQSNPSAIVSGFGGTLNLVISLGFMLAAILPFGLVFHLKQTMDLAADQVRAALVWATLWLVFITALTTAIPLWLGIRSLDRRDY